MRTAKKFLALFFISSVIVACGGEPGLITGDVGPNGTGGSGSGSGSGSSSTIPSGAVNAPLTITAMPFTGALSGTNHGYYAYTTVSAVSTITVSGITSDVDPEIYTTASFGTRDTNWVCTYNAATSSDTCYAINPVPPGTTLYIRANNFAGGSSSFILGITAPTTGYPGSPITIASMPHSGQVVTYSNSYYAYTTVAASIGTISATGLTGNIDMAVYTDAAFSTVDTNWTCTANTGTTADSCTATAPVLTGTLMHILILNRTSGAGAVFNLDVAP